MKNEKLQEIINTHKSKSNKELATILLSLNSDFENLKNVMLELTVAIGEIEETYDKVYAELQRRLKFEENG